MQRAHAHSTFHQKMLRGHRFSYKSTNTDTSAAYQGPTLMAYIFLFFRLFFFLLLVISLALTLATRLSGAAINYALGSRLHFGNDFSTRIFKTQSSQASTEATTTTTTKQYQFQNCMCKNISRSLTSSSQLHPTLKYFHVHKTIKTTFSHAYANCRRLTTETLSNRSIVLSLSSHKCTEKGLRRRVRVSLNMFHNSNILLNVIYSLEKRDLY